MSFNSQFKLIFGETFQTEGFRYCSKLNVFVKMLNEDLMAFFGVKQLRHGIKGQKDFSLLQELFLPIILLSIKNQYCMLDRI